MSYSAQLAAALSGTTPGQLAYWRSRRAGGPLLAPEYATVGRSWYSFRDVVALRTVAYLRDEVSLQRIRKAVNTLRDLGSRDHLSTYRLVADAGSVVWLQERDRAVDLVRHPGQHVLASMSEILSPFVNSSGVEVPDLNAPRPKIAVDHDVLSGYPVVKDTRVPFDLVAELVAAGVEPSAIGDYYPGVDATAARQAADYAEYVESVKQGHAA